MDAYELISYLNNVLKLGDSMDDTGVTGAYALTNGEHSTREVLRLELGRFLLYIASGNATLTDAEVSLVNVVMETDLSASQLRQLESNADVPDPSASLALMAFLSGDKTLNQVNGTRGTQSTDLLIQLYETFGNLMVDFDENAAAKARCAKYISGMKSFALKNIN